MHQPLQTTAASALPDLYATLPAALRRRIAPVSMATAAFVGLARTGPFDAPHGVDSFEAFEATFGEADSAWPLSLAVSLFFRNGGRRAVIVRAAGELDGPGATARAITGERHPGTGLQALQGAEPFGLLLTPDAGLLPDAAASDVARAAIELCERQRALYFLEAPRSKPGGELRDAVTWAQHNHGLRSPDAVAYGPAVRIVDPSPRTGTLVVSPNGAIAGLIAQSDRDSGVWKAPAGAHASLRGICGLAVTPTEYWTRKLTEVGINPLRERAGGSLVWGARTFAAPDDSAWRYLPSRRLARMVERSLQGGLTWVAAERNDERLWARVRYSVSSFLFDLFRAGAFPGATRADSFFVRCDSTTMTAADRRGGTLRLTVGLAPLRPGEFTVLTLALPARSAGEP